MNIYWFIVIFIAWYTLSVVISEQVGRHRKIGEEWSFFLCFMLSPFIGWLVTIMTKPRARKHSLMEE